jgi:hypothetical protein
VLSVAERFASCAGYLRVASMLAALGYIMERPYLAIAFYCVSQLLDAADGTIARWLNQCRMPPSSVFEAILRFFWQARGSVPFSTC